MTIKNMIIAIGRIFLNSKKNIHLIVLFFACILNILYVYKKINVSESDKMTVLTGISLLTSLFLLAVEHINFKKINETLNRYIKISRNRKNRESIVIRDTVLSLSLTTFLLMGVCFILKVFNIEYIHLLILVICYLFFGIIYTIILWNYTLSKE